MQQEYDLYELKAAILKMDAGDILQFRKWAENHLKRADGELKTKKYLIENGMSIAEPY